MKLMTYNIYRGGEDRFHFIKSLIRQIRPDVLSIQEACSWGPKRHNDIKKILSIDKGNSFILLANSRSSTDKVYNQAFYSKFKVLRYNSSKDRKTIWHVLGWFKVAVSKRYSINIIQAHLSPKSEVWRLKEVKFINSILRLCKKEPAVLLGDLNSLSPEDGYPLVTLEKIDVNKITKFGNPVRFDVVNELLEAGWYDPLPKNFYHSKGLPITVREGSKDKDHLDLRLDYIMVNQYLKRYIKNIEIIKNNLAARASDHFPVVLEIDL